MIVRWLPEQPQTLGQVYPKKEKSYTWWWILGGLAVGAVMLTAASPKGRGYWSNPVDHRPGNPDFPRTEDEVGEDAESYRDLLTREANKLSKEEVVDVLVQQDVGAYLHQEDLGYKADRISDFLMAENVLAVVDGAREEYSYYTKAELVPVLVRNAIILGYFSGDEMWLDATGHYVVKVR